MEKEPEKLEIKFQLNEISNKAMRQLNSTINAVKHIYHSILNYDVNYIPPLESETVPLLILDEENPENNTPSNDKTFMWVFKCAFEGLITGLTESLGYAYESLKIGALSKTTSLENPGNRDMILAEIEKIKERSKRLYFPSLILEIEKELNTLLLYKEEILSINQVRNCLVHRSGKVTDLDINDKGSELLRLKYVEMAIYVRENGQMVETAWELRKREAQVTGIAYYPRKMEIVYKKDELIKINQHIFNSVATTSMLFSKDLLEKVMLANGMTPNIPPLKLI